LNKNLINSQTQKNIFADKLLFSVQTLYQSSKVLKQKYEVYKEQKN
jgi:hypothetical protein